jgi:hypothetical protein
MSRGSSISAAENITTECLQLVDGTLVEQDASRTVEFDFNNGNRNVTSLSVTLLYLLAIQNSTNVPKIGTCVHASGDSFPTGDFALLPESQTAARRESAPCHAAVVITSDDGAVRRATLHTVSRYKFTYVAPIQAANGFWLTSSSLTSKHLPVHLAMILF